MGTKDSNESEYNRRRAANERNLNMSYVLIAAIVMILLIIDYVFLSRDGDFSWLGFIENIAGNLMGVLAAFLIFDIIHDKLAKESQADMVSDQILRTLLEQQGIDALNDDLKRTFITASLKALDADKEAAEAISMKLKDYLDKGAEREEAIRHIDMYSFKQRREFINTNVRSLLDNPDAYSMVENFLDKYIREERNLRVRSSFEYKFELRETLPRTYEVLSGHKDYFFVEETLTFKWLYLTEAANNLKKNRISIAFSYNNQKLDDLLRDSDCIFSENLDIHKEDVEYFKKLEPAQRKEEFVKIFKPHLSIDGNKGSVDEVNADDDGMVVIFDVRHNQELLKHTVDIVFDMPKRWNSLLEIALTEPTKNPRITMSYPGDRMKVEMYSFLSESKETTWDEAHIDDVGIYRIILNDTWVFPRSGVIFTVDKNPAVN